MLVFFTQTILVDLVAGCFFGDIFVCVLAYADDLLLLSNATRLMLSNATDFNIVYNSSKCKCILVKYNRRKKYSTLAKILSCTVST